MSKSFPLFKRAIDSKSINLDKFLTFDNIKQEIQEFQEKTRGQDWFEKLKALPEFVYDEIMEDAKKQAPPTAPTIGNKQPPAGSKSKPGSGSPIEVREPTEAEQDHYKSLIKRQIDIITKDGTQRKLTKMDSVPLSMSETNEFYRQVLIKISASEQINNPGIMKFMAAWHRMEAGWETKKGRGATYNPFNTIHPATGATNFNSVGVKNFVTFDQGVDMTAATLLSIKGYYVSLVAAIKSGDPFAAAEALDKSPWGTKGPGVRSLLTKGSFEEYPIVGLKKKEQSTII